MKSTVGDGKRGGLFLERLWRVGELNTADTCQGFFFGGGGGANNREAVRKKGCLLTNRRRSEHVHERVRPAVFASARVMIAK